MNLLLKSLPLLAALIAAPGLAAEPDPHEHGTPAAAAAKPDAKAKMQGCPMMSGQMAMNDAGKTPPKPMPKGKAGASGKMMKGHDGMPCMSAQAQAKPQTAPPPAGAVEEHDHEHPAK
jgi:hypothetical protein